MHRTRGADASEGTGNTRSRRFGKVDWIGTGTAVFLLVTTTACGAPSGAAAPAATAAASQVPAAVTEADGDTPLDPDVAPGVALAGTNAPHGQPAYASTALDVLAGIPVKGRAPKTGYARSQFGPAWADVDHNGCDTRNDMLRRDLTAVASKPGTRDCVVASGILADPYTAASISFLRGEGTSTAVQIDHVVALSDAWQKGAQQLSEAQRLSFANDPLNLLAVDGPANTSKSDGDAATWLPPNKAYRCAYVARQISVKASYGLWVTQAEHDAMARVLDSCPDVAAPTNQPASAVQQAAAPVPAAAPAPPAAYYASCAAVRAAGAAPIRLGQPGYSTKLDRDGDGVGCE